MSRAARNAGLLYCLGALVALVALGCLTASVLRRERLRERAQAEALHHEDLRTALWRMESRLGILLASATAFSQRSALESDERLSNAWIDPESYQANRMQPPAPALQERLLAAADVAFAELDREVVPSVPEDADLGSDSDWADRGRARSQKEYAQRWSTNFSLQSILPSGDAALETRVGPLATTWEEEEPGSTRQLYLSRRVETPTGPRHDVYRLSWADLQPKLLAEITDLFPEARLVPIEGSTVVDDGVAQLAAIPARLEVADPGPPDGLSLWFLLTLGSTWGAALVALAGIGLAVRASVAYGEKHRRFTYAVTHELRTPLTTFRMYSEMLARDMVPAESRGGYLKTLEQEAVRLSTLVENVLGYARLEDGGGAAPRERMRAGALLERCSPDLERICERAGARLEISDEAPDDATVSTNAGGIAQILSNLVDNACKYGCPSPGSTVRLRMHADSAFLRFDVSDEGRGLAPSVARLVFRPFERGGRDASDPAPGVGLGLALARGLARELGGRLELLRGGATTFRVSLPLAGVRNQVHPPTATRGAG